MPALHLESREPSRETRCHKCAGAVRFYAYSGMGGLAPHFYFDHCSNIFFRESDRALVQAQPASAALVKQIAATLPACPCGGRFRPDQNPKCPHCTAELSHQLGEVERLTDPYAIQIKGASLVTEIIDSN